MRGFFNRIFKLLNIGGRDWGVFLLALLLAFSTWVIHNLSLKYSVYLKVQVVAESNIEGREQKSVSGSEVMARCRTTGWRILYHRIINDGTVEVEFPSTVFQHDGGDTYFITSDKLHEYADELFGPNVSVEYFVTDRVDFEFKEEVFKRVPVKAVSSLSFKDQYMASSPLVMVPDSVTVYGNHMHLDALEYVTTATIAHSSIDENFSGMIQLTPMKGMRFSVDEVHYKMDVTRYIEIQREDVPVIIKGVPAGQKILIEPKTVDVTLYVEFPLKADPKKDLLISASYDELKTSLSDKVMLYPSSLPLGVIKYEIRPVAVKIVEVGK
jgi:hypothetical protein